jgi:hypothetical protein
MKALSLLQPWASLVVWGHKTIETRSWRTAYRGELLIHASRGKSGELIAQEPAFKRHIPHYDRLPFGALIGKVLLTDVVPVDALFLSDSLINKLSMEERAFGDYTRGRYAWMLEEPVAFADPIRINGSLGLWDYELNT